MSRKELYEGAVVWAKCHDYPWWPAMIEKDPDTHYFFVPEDKNSPAKYHVVFLDKAVSRAWVSKDNVQQLLPSQDMSLMGPFVSTKTKKKYKRKVKEAFNNALMALKMHTPTRLEKYSFLNRISGNAMYESSDENDYGWMRYSEKKPKKRQRRTLPKHQKSQVKRSAASNSTSIEFNMADDGDSDWSTSIEFEL